VHADCNAALFVHCRYVVALSMEGISILVYSVLLSISVYSVLLSISVAFAAVRIFFFSFISAMKIANGCRWFLFMLLF